MSLSIVPFDTEHLPAAAELLARKHRADRAVLPMLPPRFEDPAMAAAAIAASLRRPRAAGFAALDGGQLVAYLIGDLLIDRTWGRTGWVRPAGCAYSPAAGVEVVRDLYAALGAAWVADGILAHLVQTLVTDPPLMQAWFSLSFGIEQVHALADLEALRPAAPVPPPGLELRQAGQADRDHLAELSDVIWRQHASAPVWAAQLPETARDTARAWAEQADEPGITVWLAFQAGRVVGIQGYWAAEDALGASDDLLYVPEHCAHMSMAGTRADARGRGVSTLLARNTLAQAHALGYRFCDTDWRSTNLLASRFWPRFGYQPVLYRLVRRLDPRIAWTHARSSD